MPSSDLHSRIAALEAALQQETEIDFPPSPPTARQSLDQNFDHISDPYLFDDISPYPTPRQERPNPFNNTNNHTNNKYNTNSPSPPLTPIATNSNSNSPSPSPFPPNDTIASSFHLHNHTDYIVYNAFVTNLRVCPVNLTADDARWYYIEHRSFLPTVPGVILREGSDKEGRSLGVAHLPLQGENRIGVGDVKGRPGEVIWEGMNKTTFWTHSRYRFEYAIPSSSSSSSSSRKILNWIRTRNNVLDDQGDLVLIEEGNESEVLVEYTGKGLLKWKKRGKLRVRDMEEEGWGEEWLLWVLLSWASVVEVSSFCLFGFFGLSEWAREGGFGRVLWSL